jgi:hypothetical protein
MRSSGTNARSNDKSGQQRPILECFKAARLRDIAETRDIAPVICSQEANRRKNHAAARSTRRFRTVSNSIPPLPAASPQA